MKKFLLLMTVAIAALSMMAAPVDRAAAQRKAQNYLKQMYAGKMMSSSALNPVLLKAEVGDAKTGMPVYYIYNTSTTFLVVAGDDRAEEILMEGDAPLKDINNLSPSMQAVLDQYKQEIMFLHENPDLKVNRPSDATPSLRAVTYGPLLTAKWDQMAPYWNQCVFTYNNKSYQCLTGCPATSASMVLYYWKYPTTQVPAVASYTASLELSYYNSVNFTYPSVSATTFDWANMKDSYSSYTTAQGTAVATLMRYVGQLEKMMYGTESAGGSGIYTTNSQIIATMFKTLGYDSNTRLVNKSSYSEANWGALIQGEMAASRPVVYLGVDTQGGGHAFNVDGYRDSDGKYHVNFGWSGDGNSWYAMNSFTYSGYTFSSSQQAIIGIQPPGGAVATPELTVNPTSLSFADSEVGETYTKTFTVTGSDLQGNVTISKSGSSVYSVSPTTLTAAQAAAGATVTVTYKPTAVGTQSGTITVSSTNADSKTVTLTGTAANVTKLTVDPTALDFSTTVGTPVTKTFTVTGKNLPSGSTVTLACYGNGFAINKTNITRAAVTNGAEVTVTFTPTASGNYSGSVVLSCTNCEDVTVALSGTAIGVPTLVAAPQSLSFNTVLGTPVTKTFTVTGTDLTGNVSLAVTGNGFSIDKTSINRTAAAEGATVTVTYNPTASGSSTGTVTLTSNGAQTVTVSLSGIATTVPTIMANPTTLNFVTTVGTPVTQTFVINSAYLEGNVSLAVEGEGFAIDKTEIAQGAANNATVTVTYTPTAYGTHTGTVTLTSPNAQPVTVTLNGQADLVKYAPVMLPANETYVNLTKFRADWTDATPAENIASYTLEVTPKPVEPQYELIATLSGTSYSGSGYYAVTLTAPWSGTNVRGHNNQTLYFRNNYNNNGSYGGIYYTVPAGYQNATFTVKITSGTDASEAVGNLTVSTPQTAGVTNYFTPSQTYSWLVTASAGEKISITTPDAQYSPDIATIEIYAGDATVMTFNATETGDANYRLIEGITNRFYTVENLTAEGTFLYRVKALYLDGTESDWSNIEEVTLFENGHGYQLGDVNHDGAVNISDVTLLISAVMNNNMDDICPICADFSNDGEVNITDVTQIISYVSSMTQLRAPASFDLVK